MKEKKYSCFDKFEIPYYLFILVLSFFFVFIASLATSPIASGEPFGGDAAMFQTIGKGWANGMLPYIDIWDSKGPIIFLINAIGYRFSGSRTGVFILQIISSFISNFFIFKTLRLKYLKRQSIGLTVLMMGVLVMTYAGNSTEEFLLPLLTPCFYFIAKWVLSLGENSEVEHSPAAAFLYGFTFSFCFLTRFTNCVGLCAAILVIAIFLIVNKRYNNLFKNAIAFIGGAILLIIPFAIYFASKGILYDALYGTFLYNIDYAMSSVGNDAIDTIKWLRIVIAYSSPAILSIWGLFEIVKKKKQGALLLTVGIISLFLLYSGNKYLHYGAICYPYLTIFLVDGKSYFDTIKKDGFKKGAIILVSIYFSVCLIGSLTTARSYIAHIYHKFITPIESDGYVEAQEELLKYIPEDEKNSIVAYNVNSGFYLQHDIKPVNRFFTMQDWAASRSEKHTNLMLKEYASSNIKWIFVEGDPQKTLIADIINEQYELVDTRNKGALDVVYYLYRHIDY
ncbi:MAG TPA: glycosyltransferase family 39 protein [Clostridiales bacterium]|nr:glycosyltransferase family 39 protein [Clostridiales bacterium]